MWQTTKAIVYMKDDGLLLAALPSGGSDWFASCIRMAQPTLRYAREFFCPMCNWQYAGRLERDLGDTTYAATDKLCVEMTDDSLNSLLNDTWRREDYNFCKENYLPWKLTAFSKQFTTVVLVRDFDDTFPPNRQRVIRWYEHFYCALFNAGQLDEESVMEATNPTARAAIGFFYFRQKLIDMAHELDLPLIYVSKITRQNATEITDAVKRVPVDTQALVDAIVQTRRNVVRPAMHFVQWQDAIELHKRLDSK